MVGMFTPKVYVTIVQDWHPQHHFNLLYCFYVKILRLNFLLVYFRSRLYFPNKAIYSRRVHTEVTFCQSLRKKVC